MTFLSRHGTLVASLIGMIIAFCLWKVAGLSGDTTQFYNAAAWYGGAFAAFFLMVFFVVRFWGQTFISVEMLIVWALVFRGILFFMPQVLSDDIYRYIWDGRVSAHGINPYRFAPEADNLTGLRDSTIYPHVNHRDIPTIYPPFAQLIFQASSWIFESIASMKLFMLLFDIGVIFLLLAFLKYTERALSWVVIWAWNPLVILEIAGQGHVDVVAVFFTMLGLFLATQARAVWAGGVLGLAFVSKLSGWYFLPFLEDIRHRWQTLLLAILLFLGVAGVFYLPYGSASEHWFSGLEVYTSRWEFNGALYSGMKSVFEKILNGDTDPGHFMGWETENKPRLLAKIILSIIFIGTYGFLLFRFYRKSFENQKNFVLHAAYIVTCVLLVVSPTIHPWYLLWIIPFLCFFPNPAWLIWSATVALSYSILPTYWESGKWQEDPQLLLIQVSLPALILLFYLVRWLRQRRSAHPSHKAE